MMSLLIQAKLHSWPSGTGMYVQICTYTKMVRCLNGLTLSSILGMSLLLIKKVTQLKRGDFYRSVNGLCYKFKGTLLNSDVASRLFQTYCCSFYGSQAWNLSSSSFEFICTAWNKAVRRIFHLPYNTHRYLLSSIVQTSHIRYQLVERFRTFFASCMSSENILITLLALNAHFCNSPMSMNRRYADKLLVEKKMIWLRRKAAMQLYCHHCSK